MTYVSLQYILAMDFSASANSGLDRLHSEIQYYIFESETLSLIGKDKFMVELDILLT